MLNNYCHKVNGAQHLARIYEQHEILIYIAYKQETFNLRSGVYIRIASLIMLSRTCFVNQVSSKFSYSLKPLFCHILKIRYALVIALRLS